MIETFLPIVLAPPTIIEAQEDKAQALFDLMMYHMEQGRHTMAQRPTLMKAAHEKCFNMAHYWWEGHTDPHGEGPNDMVRRYGYKLPSYYGKGAANNIESIGYGGTGNLESMWNTFLSSPGHRTHILGLDPFYAKQTNIGVGYYHLEDSRQKHYWCILSAPPEGTE